MGFRNFVKWLIPFAFIGIIISIIVTITSLAINKDSLMVGSVIIFGLLALSLMIFFIALWIWMIIDVIIRELDGTEKIIWLLLMIFLGGIISIIYFYVHGKKGLKTKKAPVSKKKTK